jgi:2-polyprenyl-3-methyl-5-hydroxy-6-metoxy-1,4-benzoquinol methylase
VERLVPETDPRLHVIREHLARYNFAARFVTGKNVLDVACGSGYGAAILKNAGAMAVTGVDISDEAVAYARVHHAADGIEFVVGDAERLSPSGPFDVVVSFETIEHIAHPKAFLAESTRLLAPGGVLIVSTPVRLKGTLADRPANPHHVREWSLPEFQALLCEHYRHVDIHGQYTFKKGVLPYSRTAKAWVFALRYRQQARELEQMTVRSSAPAFPGFAFAMGYAVALCRQG